MTKSERISKLEEEIVELTRAVNELEHQVDELKRNSFNFWRTTKEGLPPIQVPAIPYKYDRFYC